MFVRVCMCMYASLCACMYLCVSVCTCVFVCACLCVCVYACMCVCVFVLYKRPFSCHALHDIINLHCFVWRMVFACNVPTQAIT